MPGSSASSPRRRRGMTPHSIICSGSGPISIIPWTSQTPPELERRDLPVSGKCPGPSQNQNQPAAVRGEIDAAVHSPRKPAPFAAHSLLPFAAHASPPPFAAHATPPPFTAHSLPPFVAQASPPPSVALPHTPPFVAKEGPPAVSIASPPAVSMASPPVVPMASPPAVPVASLPVAAPFRPVPAPRQHPKVSALPSCLEQTDRCQCLYVLGQKRNIKITQIKSNNSCTFIFPACCNVSSFIKMLRILPYVTLFLYCLLTVYIFILFRSSKLAE